MKVLKIKEYIAEQQEPLENDYDSRATLDERLNEAFEHIVRGNTDIIFNPNESDCICTKLTLTSRIITCMIILN